MSNLEFTLGSFDILELAPSDIQEAPLDGTIILTDVGLVYYSHRQNNWIYCNLQGHPFMDIANMPAMADPEIWYATPKLTRKEDKCYYMVL